MWIWFNSNFEKLPASLSSAFEEEDATFGLSAVSIWETLMAMEKGRVNVNASPEDTVRLWLRENPFEIFPLDRKIALLSRTLPFEHEDPADRFIAATAYHLNCPLVTADSRLQRLPWLRQLG